MYNLPNDLLIKIISFLNFKKKDILLLNLVSKKYHTLLWEKITLYDYPYLHNESYYHITADYHVYVNYLKKLNEEANIMYERDNINMLLENHWM
tara:strand:- start:200 stop:481 length:282 start_codon:yes stop_codon:yes gene_type:complete